MKYKLRFFVFLFLIIATGLTLSACTLENSSKTEEKGKLQVAATIFPVYDIMRQVGGENISASLILPPGASPHTFDPTPSQVADLKKADIVFMVGAGIDGWALDLLASNSQAKIVDLSGEVILRPFIHEEHEEGEYGEEENHEHGDLDPHYWLDPENAKMIADKVAQELIILDENQTDEYTSRAFAFKEEINRSLLLWQERLNGFSNRKLAVFHDAWGYFAERFGLEIVATFEPFPGKSPSPQYLIEMQAEIKEHEVKALFIEPQLSSAAAEALAKDLGVEIWRLDPIGGLTGRESYLELINYNIEAVYGALSASK